MPATQPIPRNAMSSSDIEADRILGVHNKATDGRRKPPGVQVQRGTVPGENAGTKVSGGGNITGGSV